MKFNVKLKLPQQSDFQKRILKTQKFIDSEIIRKSAPYVPFQTGMLRDSAKFGTKIGSGIIRYIAPYAKYQYYYGKASGKKGRYWIKRAMISHGKEIINGAQKIFAKR